MIFMHGLSAHILSPAFDSSTANPALMRHAAEFSCVLTSISAKSATRCLILRRTNIFVLKSVDSFPTLPIMRLHTAGVISSVGRAPPLQGGGRRFEPVITHHLSDGPQCKTKDKRWVISSVGRAPPLQGGGRRFEPVITHHLLYFVTEMGD